MFVVLVGLMGLAPYEIHGNERLYHLTQVVTQADAKACAEGGGLAAMLFILTPRW